jgi:hypothetical protein
VDLHCLQRDCLGRVQFKLDPVRELVVRALRICLSVGLPDKPFPSSLDVR